MRFLFSKEWILRACVFLIVTSVFTEARAAESEFKVFDGEPKILVAFAHASWKLLDITPTVLDNMGHEYIRLEHEKTDDFPLDDNHAVTEKWLEDFDYTNNDSGVIVIVKSPTGAHISGPDRTEEIDRQVAKMEKLTEMLQSKGADLVLYTTHHFYWHRFRDIYKENPPTATDQNDTLVLNEYQRRADKPVTIDLITPSVENYPYAVVSDLEHPTGYGNRLYTFSWMKKMYEYDGLEVPSIFDELLASFLNKQKEGMAEVDVEIVEPAAPDTLRMKDSVTLRVTVDPERLEKEVQAFVHIIGYVGGCVGQYIVKDTIPIEQEETMLKVAIPDSASVFMYAPGSAPEGYRFPLEVDSAQIQVLLNPSSYRLTSYTYAMSRSFILTDENGNRPWVGVATQNGPVEQYGPLIRSENLSAPGKKCMYNLLGRLYYSSEPQTGGNEAVGVRIIRRKSGSDSRADIRFSDK